MAFSPETYALMKAQGGGGGGSSDSGALVVGITIDFSGDEPDVLSVDKTPAEIKAAIDNGKAVIGVVSDIGLQLSLAELLLENNTVSSIFLQGLIIRINDNYIECWSVEYSIEDGWYVTIGEYALTPN